MHQHEVAVFDLRREHTELRLDVRARVIVRDNEFAVGCAGLLREGIVSAECVSMFDSFLKINPEKPFDNSKQLELFTQNMPLVSSRFTANTG